MTFSAMYMGMSPFEAPATYTLLQYAEYAKGVFYPIGGFQTVVAAFEKVAKQFGAEFVYDSSVAKILLDDGGEDEEGQVRRMLGGQKQGAHSKRPSPSRVKGVQLDNGRQILADAVVSNADLVWTVSRPCRARRCLLLTDDPSQYNK